MEPFLFGPSSRIDWYRTLVSDPLSWSCVTALYCFVILTLRACFEKVSGEGSMNPFYLRDRANEMRRLPSRLLSSIFPPVFLVDLASETYWIVRIWTSCTHHLPECLYQPLFRCAFTRREGKKTLTINLFHRKTTAIPSLSVYRLSFYFLRVKFLSFYMCIPDLFSLLNIRFRVKRCLCH